MTIRKFETILKENPDKEVKIGLSKRKIKTIDIASMPFGQFVDLENYLQNNQYQEFSNIFVKRFQFVRAKHLASILTNYGLQKKELFSQFIWVFDPPSFGEPTQETVGSELRKEFVEEFGAYVVLTDLVCKGQIVNYKEVEKWQLQEFLFWANYLSGQRILENVK